MTENLVTQLADIIDVRLVQTTNCIGFSKLCKHLSLSSTIALIRT